MQRNPEYISSTSVSSASISSASISTSASDDAAPSFPRPPSRATRRLDVDGVRRSRPRRSRRTGRPLARRVPHLRQSSSRRSRPRRRGSVRASAPSTRFRLDPLRARPARRRVRNLSARHARQPSRRRAARQRRRLIPRLAIRRDRAARRDVTTVSARRVAVSPRQMYVKFAFSVTSPTSRVTSRVTPPSF